MLFLTALKPAKANCEERKRNGGYLYSTQPYDVRISVISFTLLYLFLRQGTLHLVQEVGQTFVEGCVHNISHVCEG